jgi:hypothetical protein
MADDSNDDPVLRKYAWQGALAEADRQLSQLTRYEIANLRKEFIAKFVSVAMATGCNRKSAINEAMAYFGVSASTVEAALAFAKEKGQAPRAHDDGLEDI